MYARANSPRKVAIGMRTNAKVIKINEIARK